MKRAARLLRGSVRVRVESDFPERVLNLCGAHGILFSELCRESARALSFSLRAAERRRLEALLAPLGVTLTVERAEGVPFFLRRLRRRRALLAGLAAVVLLVLLNSFFIWDIEVSGNEAVPSEKIVRVLEEQGLRRGSFAYSFRPRELCNRVLPELPELAWLTVNVRGCRAYIQVRERVAKPEIVNESESTNIVASRDAIITEVRAYDGKTLVRRGATVTQGQLLISGAVETENVERPSVASRLVAGRGEVWGRTWYELSAKIPLQYEQLCRGGEEENSYALLFGTMRVKIGAKGSSNLQSGCDTIIHQTRLTLPGGMALPLVWEKTTRFAGELRTVERSREEAEAIGKSLLTDYLLSRIDGTITTARVRSTEQGGWLLVTLSAECLEQIGRSVPILTEE